MKAGYSQQTTRGALNYLIQNKDAYGTWDSTQATILSLKALVYAAEHLQEDEGEANITIYLNGELTNRIKIDESNNDVLQVFDLKELTKRGENTVEIRYEGESNLYYQIVGKYFMPWRDKPAERKILDIDVEYNTTYLKVNDMVQVEVTITYNGAGSLNLVIVDLGIPPGFSVVEEDLERVRQAGKIGRYDIAGRQIIAYVENIRADTPLKFSYRIRANYPIKAKTPESRVYEYYNPDIMDKIKPIAITVTQLI
jgi:hypothetical protein